MKNSILLYSGGIDSFVAYHYLQQPQTLYFDLKTKYTEKELRLVRDIVPNTIVDTSLDLSRREQASAHVPFRNALLAMQAAYYADTIYIVGVKDDHVSDKTPEMFLEFSKLLSKLENRNINVLSPFWDMTKSEIIAWYMQNVDKSGSSLVRDTISCYSDSNLNYCGQCAACFRKWNALRVNGIDIHFYNDTLLDEYYEKAQNGYYIPERNKSIIQEIDAYRS